MSFAYAIITFTTSFATMCYAMIISTIISDFTGEEILAQCLTIGPYLLGLGLGSLLGDRLHQKNYLSYLWRFEWWSVLLLPLIPALLLVGIFLFLHLSPMGVTMENKTGLQFLLSLSGCFSFVAGFLGGAQLPIILKLAQHLKKEVVLAINYAGPLFAGPFIAVTTGLNYQIVSQITVVAFIQLVGMSFIIGLRNQKRLLLLFVFPLALLTILNVYYGKLEHTTIKSSYLGTRLEWGDLTRIKTVVKNINAYGDLERVKTPYQVIDLFVEPPLPHEGRPGNATLYLNRKPQFDLFFSDTYHESMVYGGMNVLPHPPTNVLILGAGDGLLLKEFKKIPEVKSITMVELDPGMIEWSKKNYLVSSLNQHSLSDLDPRVHLIVGDAITFLRHHDGKRYDLILIDFPFPNGHELSKLYSYEFYRLVKKVIHRDSAIVIDLPIQISEKGDIFQETKVILKTMAAAGLGTPLIFGPYSSFLVLKGDSMKPAFDYQKFPSHLKLATKSNLVETLDVQDIPPKEWKTTTVNSMFWPRGL